jgi:cytidine deaminase
MFMEMNTLELIQKAAAVVKPKKVGDKLFADVGCALLTSQGNVYLGVCIDVSSGMGFCAEHTAISQMITHGEYEIDTIVAVWKDDKGDVFVIPPCGRCREFIKQATTSSLETNVIISKDNVVKLKELLPYENSWEKV